MLKTISLKLDSLVCYVSLTIACMHWNISLTETLTQNKYDCIGNFCFGHFFFFFFCCPYVYPLMIQLQSYRRQRKLYFKGHLGLQNCFITGFVPGIFVVFCTAGWASSYPILANKCIYITMWFFRGCLGSVYYGSRHLYVFCIPYKN